MSQSATAPPAPAPQPAPVPVLQQPRVGTPVGAPVGTPAVDTPRLLNRWQLIGVTTVVVFGLLSALVQLLSWQSDGRAADDTEQLVRVQEIQSSLLHADALATNAFLNGGLEPVDQREQYDAAIDDVQRLIADAAEAQSADREALAALNEAVGDYATAVTEARVNNRQRQPVGAEYLSGASAALRAEALPILDELVAANEQRAEDAMGGQHPYWLLGLAVAALVVLWWLNRQHARHFRRRFNVGVLTAALLVLVVSLVTIVLAIGRSGDNDDLLAGSFRTAVDQAEARTAANDAKANESLRLIARGSGQAFEDAWVAAAATVDQALLEPSLNGLQGSWATYKSQHQEIVDLDDGGDWDAAVVAATSTEDGSASDTFADFDAQLQDSLSASGTATTQTLTNGNSVLLVLAVIAFLAALAAAGFAASGVNQRLKEFS